MHLALLLQSVLSSLCGTSAIILLILLPGLALSYEESHHFREIAFSSPQEARANATFYTLCRNSDLFDILETIQNYNYRFNNRYHYDWVFLNDQPFTEEFIKLVNASVAGEAHFGLIPKEQWSLPDSVNIAEMKRGMDKLMNDPDGAVPYGDSLSYRHMCRFESGFFYRHELLQRYDYFWRVEPGVRLRCEVRYDLFKYLQDGNYDYGFTISLLEYPKTIPSLFSTFRKSLHDLGVDGLLADPNNYSGFIVDRNTGEYNYCHFWTNFEIGNLNVFRSRQYNEIFEKLDQTNGFYYERWGDAPVRSLILSTILERGRIKRLANIGYTHPPYTQCPRQESLRIADRCSCNPETDITEKYFSCSWYFDQLSL
ncbi:DEKNAAC102558 [Brettanomyces naardenensis]|uniref:DEKNAAC102558 n=1 Tax=Brettanomyces naardenensis TaxID=13370 RepID=A0A448YK71_BRENA|nr:DEKNAAC102558 [Brettanomyces naardenensis]